MQPIEIDSKYISIMEFREKLIMEELEQYAKTLTGEGESILPFIRDENGNYSEEKTWKFIGELTEYAHVYWEYYQECQRQSYRENSSFSESDIEMLAGPSASFSQDEKDFLQNFFYCAIRVAEVDLLCNLRGRHISQATQTFQDFIRYSSEQYASRAELYVGEATAEAYRSNYAELKGLYRPASLLTHLFTGKDLSERYPEWEQEKYGEYLPTELKENLKQLGCRPSAFIYELFGDPDQSDAVYGEACFEEEAEWLKTHFTEQKQFVERYLAFKNRKYALEYEESNVICSSDPESVAQNRLRDLVISLDRVVKGAVRLFTDSRKIYRIQDDNAYFTASTLLRQARKRLKKLDREDKGRGSYV